MKPNRREFLTLTGAGMIAATQLGSPVLAAPPAAGDVEVENLGIPLHTVRMTTSVSGTWSDGRPVLYAAGSQVQQELQFVVFDVATGEQIDAVEVEEAEQTHSMVLAPDGNVYIAVWGPIGYLLRYSPETREMTNLGRPLDGDGTMTQIVAGDNGKLYGGGFPSGRVFSFDLATEEFEDLGVAIEGEQYARSLAYSPGRLFVGSEGVRARMVSIDLETGAKVEIASPEWAVDETRHYDLEYRDGLLFSYTSPSLDWHVYDVEAGEWIDRIERNAQGGMTAVDANGSVYFVKLSDGLYRYDLESRTASNVGWSQGLTGSHGAAGISLIELGTPEWPGQTVMGLGSRGQLWLWNPEKGQGEMRTTDAPVFPVTVRSLGLGPDENIYVGGTTAEVSVGAFDTDTDEFLRFTRGPSARIDAFAISREKLYFTAYGPGSFIEYDPSQEYVWGQNPDELFRLYEDYGQERIYALEVLDDSTLVMGGIGGRGVDTGQLFHYDPASGSRTDLGAPIEGLSIASLTHVGDLLIGGTSIVVLGGTSPQPEARLFIWDLNSDSVVWDGVPVPGASDISELVVDEGGTVWGLTTSGVVFEFNLEEREVLSSITVAEAGGQWGHGTLEFGPDGRLYGSSAAGEVFLLAPSTRESAILAQGEHAVFDLQGRLYFAWDGSLYRISNPEGIALGPSAALDTLRASMKGHEVSGGLDGPIVRRLGSSLDSARKHFDAEREEQAAKALERFIRQLDRPNPPDVLTERARTELRGQAAAVLDRLGH